MSTDDQRPIEEPPNSTVKDWHGQKVADDAELVDELVEDHDGDLDAAEEEFDRRSAGNDPSRDIQNPEPK